MRLFLFFLSVGVAIAQSTLPVTPLKGTQLDNPPILGLGTWGIQLTGGNVTEIIASAIQTGYRHIDCATYYGNQKLIAPGIKEGLRRTGLSRGDLWITSKLWNDRHADPEAGIKEALAQLGLDYLDLFLVHWPVSQPKAGPESFDHVETWKGMEKLVPQKFARHIGISNFSPKQVDEVLEIATIKPKIHQIELHPYLHQEDFLASLFKKNITAIAFAPLGNTNQMYSSLWTGRLAPKMLTNTILNDIGKARGCTAAQVALAWNMARKVVVIPKAASLEHQKENYATVEKCKLQSEDLQKIKAVNIPERFVMWPCKGLGYTCFTGLEAPEAAQGY